MWRAAKPIRPRGRWPDAGDDGEHVVGIFGLRWVKVQHVRFLLMANFAEWEEPRVIFAAGYVIELKG